MTLTKVLIRLAEYSPKSYAKQIRKRNESLLERLMLLEPYIGRTNGEVPDDILRKVLKRTKFGCPHCDGWCDDCLWNTTRIDKRHGGCTRAMFDHVCLNHFSDRISIGIFYGMTSEGINIYSESDLIYLDETKVLKKSDWDKCVRFVQAHIEWAKLDCWGKKYKNESI